MKMSWGTGRTVATVLYCFFLPIALCASPETLSFEKTTIQALAAGKVIRTRAEITGYVAYVTKEADGDWHIRLGTTPNTSATDTNNFVICEIMPEIPFPPPSKGQSITVRGITRYDGQHKWWEIHPVEGIK